VANEITQEGKREEGVGGLPLRNEEAGKFLLSVLKGVKDNDNVREEI
jgi:hypothetical protein